MSAGYLVDLKKPTKAEPSIQLASDLLSRSFAPLSWAIGDIVPEGVTLVVGPPKVGKSWLLLQFAIAIACGSAIWDGREPEEVGEVLLLALEDNDRRLQSRIRKLNEQPAANAHPTDGDTQLANFSRLHLATEWPRMDKGGVVELEHWLAAHPNVRMVVIDTLGRFRPLDSGRGSAYQADYTIGAELKPLADRYNVAIVLVHHTRKMAASDPLDTISGTQGLAGSVDAALLLRRERGKMDAALYVTGRDIEDERNYALRFDTPTCTWSAIGSVDEAKRTPERQAIIDLLSRMGPTTPVEISTALGKERAAVRQLLSKMLRNGELMVTDGNYCLSATCSNKDDDSHDGYNGKRGYSTNSSNSRSSANTDTPSTPVTPVTVVTPITVGTAHTSDERDTYNGQMTSAQFCRTAGAPVTVVTTSEAGFDTD